MKIALISDIHSNLEAFQAVLKDIKKRKIKKILCLGDIIGYAASPNECIELIKENNIPPIMGNHDLCCVNLTKIEWFNPIAQQAVLWTNKMLTTKNKQFLSKLPKSIKKENMFLVHGSPRDKLYEYIFPNTNETILKDFFNKNKRIKILMMGHTHVPFIKKIYKLLNPKGSKDLENSKNFQKNKKIKKLIINPGSVGQPRDNNPKASYCILDNKKLEAKIIRLDYPIKKAADKILKAKLPEFLALRLFLGN